MSRTVIDSGYYGLRQRDHRVGWIVMSGFDGRFMHPLAPFYTLCSLPGDEAFGVNEPVGPGTLAFTLSHAVTTTFRIAFSRLAYQERWRLSWNEVRRLSEAGGGMTHWLLAPTDARRYLPCVPLLRQMFDELCQGLALARCSLTREVLFYCLFRMREVDWPFARPQRGWENGGVDT